MDAQAEEARLLDVALKLAREGDPAIGPGHSHQVDKSGKPYIAHIQRVVDGVSSTRAKIVAALHDLIEDGGETGFSLDHLVALGLPEDIRDAVDAISKCEDETQDLRMYWDRVKANPLSLEVKFADMADNEGRLEELAKNDPVKAEELRVRYRKARAHLQSQESPHKAVRDS